MTLEFDSFLNSHYARDGKFTHTSMARGSYCIVDEEYNNFFDLYINAIDDGASYCLTEKHRENISNVGVDVDLRFNKKPDSKLITEFMEDMVKYLTGKLKKVFSNKEKFMCVATRRKSGYMKDGVYKDGFHLMFPYIICRYEIQFALRNQFIKEYDLKIGQINDIEEVYDKGVIKSTNWTVLYSQKPIRNKNKEIIGLYEPYEIYKIYNSNVTKDSFSKLKWAKELSIRYGVDESEEVKPINMISLNKYLTTPKTPTTIIIHKDKKRNESDSDTDDSDNGSSEDESDTKDDKKTIIDVPNNWMISYDENSVIRAVSMFNKNRVDTRKTWIDVGTALHYCSMTDKDKKINFFRIWNEWSKKSDKYEDGECKKLWNKFKLLKKNNLTIASLIYWAQEDSPTKYYKNAINKYVKENINIEDLDSIDVKKVIKKPNMTFIEFDTNGYCPVCETTHETDTVYACANKVGLTFKCTENLYEQYPTELPALELSVKDMKNTFGIRIEEKKDLNYYKIKPEYNVFPEDKVLNDKVYLGLSCSGWDILNLVKYLHQDDLYYLDDKQKNWCQFKNGRWIVGPNELTLLLSEEILPHYVKLRRYYDALHIRNPKLIDDHKLVIRQLDKIMDLLKSPSNKAKWMSDAYSIFRNQSFATKLDSIPHLLGFDNGVYDLENFVFRDGKIDDYVSMSTHLDYSDEKTEYYDIVMQFIKDIQPKKNQREFLLKYLSLGLVGVNPDEKAIILSGEHGRNGKSKLMSLMLNALGDYCTVVPSNFLTEPLPPPNSPMTALKSVINKRFVISLEPSIKHQINTALFKFLTGNDSTPVRGLYENTMTIYNPTQNYTLVCNKTPAFDDMTDRAVFTRINCVEFKMRFVDNPNPNNECEKKIDKTLLIKFQTLQYKQAWIQILINYYKKYRKEGLTPPDEILEFTKQYKTNNDVVAQYLEKRVIDAKENIYAATLYYDFKPWYLDNYDKKTLIAKNIFISALKQHLEVKTVKVGGVNGVGVMKKAIKEKEHQSDLDSD
jgi:P4 family phage/plasmid primase-like protien